MQTRLKTRFPRLSEAEFQARVGLILSSLADNPKFPEPWPAPAPSLAQLNQAFDAYREAYNASMTRDTLRIAVRQALRDELTDTLHHVLRYLEFVAHNDETALRTTGFDVGSETVHHVDRNAPLPAPEGLKLKRGMLRGQLDLKISRLDGAGSYEVQSTTGDPADEAGWHQALVSTTCSHMTLRDQPPMQTCWVRVRGIGSQGGGCWSEPASIVVL